MNKGQYEVRLKAFNARAAELDELVSKASQTKSYGDLQSLEKRIDDLARERKALDDAAEHFDGTIVRTQPIRHDRTKEHGSQRQRQRRPQSGRRQGTGAYSGPRSAWLSCGPAGSAAPSHCASADGQRGAGVSQFVRSDDRKLRVCAWPVCSISCWRKAFAVALTVWTAGSNTQRTSPGVR
jgi:hypothetical protein